jgi:hypothetical protein
LFDSDATKIHDIIDITKYYNVNNI